MESIPKPQPFKLKQFSNVSSKISTRRVGHPINIYKIEIIKLLLNF